MSSQSQVDDAAPNWLAFSGADKVAHMILYGGLTFVVSWSIRRSNESPRPWVQWGIPVIFAVFYGVTDEIHQYYVPNRAMDAWDLLADGVGGILVQSVWCGIVWRVPLRNATT